MDLNVMKFILISTIWSVFLVSETHAGLVAGSHYSSLSERAACKVVDQPLQNGGFESGKLGAWFVYPRPSSTTSVRLVKGYKSKYAAELKVTTPQNQTQGQYSYLGQYINLCKGVTYDYSWFQYEVPNSTYFPQINFEPNMFPKIVSSGGGLYGMYGFQMFSDYYADGDQHYPAGKWRQFKDTITPFSSGRFTFQFQILESGASTSGTFRFDTVVMKARK